MQKFQDLPYKRPDPKVALAILKESKKMLKKAKSPEDAQAAYLKLNEIASELLSMKAIATIRSMLDMNDEFYASELRYRSLKSIHVQLHLAFTVKAFAKSKHRGAIEERFGPQTFIYREAMLKWGGLKAAKETKIENELVTKYRKLMASFKVELNGEQYGFYDLLKRVQSINREERQVAFHAFAGFHADNAKELDGIYDQLLKVRVKKAKKFGFDKYIDYAYASKRREYTPKETANFRESVKKHIVPLYAQIAETQRQRHGLETLTFFDETVFYPDGNPQLLGEYDDVIAATGKMFEGLSPETGEFFKFMTDYNLIDLEARPGKQLGGFCNMILEYKAPYIFGNFNGTSDDVFMITHEAGHAFQAYLASRKQELAEYYASTSEINEIHAMAMEFFPYPWMELYFGEDAEKYRVMRIAKRLYSILYHVCVDEFQEEVYNNPTMTADQRRQVWKTIENKYVPWCNYDGNEYFASGGSWMIHQHIVLYPFYIIEYALSQICAYQYYARSLENSEAAWADYMKLCAAGGSKGYFELLKEGNLENPLEDKTVEETAAKVKAILKM